MLPPCPQLLEVKDEPSYLLDANAGNIGGEFGCFQEFAENGERGNRQANSAGDLTLCPGAEPVALYQVAKIRWCPLFL